MGYGLCVYIRRALSRSQYSPLLPICCSISVSWSSKPAAFPGFNSLRPVASSLRLKVSSIGGWLVLGTIVVWCSPGGLRCSTLLPLDESWLAIWSAVTVVTTGGGGRHCLPKDDGCLPMLFLLFMVRLLFYTMSPQILRLSSEVSSSKVSPSWIVDSENGSLWYSVGMMTQLTDQGCTPFGIP